MRNKQFLNDMRACSGVSLATPRYNPFARKIDISLQQDYYGSPLNATLERDLNWLENNPTSVYRFRFLSIQESEYFVERNPNEQIMPFLFVCKPDPNREGLLYKLFSQIPDFLEFTG